MSRKLSRTFFQDKKSILLILLGTIAWSLTMIKSGLVYSYGMGFWGPNGHDGVWHIALASGLANGSWEMPIFAGEIIKNYHIGFDLVLAILHKLTFVPIYVLYFQILPPILSVLVGLYSYLFIRAWTNDKGKAYWGTFFVYFGGSFGWILTLIRSNQISGESIFWSQQSISTLINPPFALSLVLIFAGLYFLLEGIKNNSKRNLVLATFLFGVLVQMKVYAGILVLVSLFVAGIWGLLKRESLVLIKVFTGSLIISILLFTPTTKEIGQTLILKPFWFLETMMSFSDRIGWSKFGEAMVNYKLGQSWIKAVLAYGFAFLIFVIGNLGTRLLVLFDLWKRKFDPRSCQYIDVLTITLIISGFLIPLFFVQSGTYWNTIQFMYYSLIFIGILAGSTFVDIIRMLKTSRLQNRFFEIILLLLTLPTTLGMLYNHYLPLRPPAMISKAELEALNFLSKQPQGIVLTQLFDKAAADAAINKPPRPLYLYESTAYVSAFSEKPVYLEDQVNLEITGYNWIVRRNEVEKYFIDITSEESLEFLRRNKIKYLYMVKGFQQEDLGLSISESKIFENQEIEIYRVN